MSINLRNKSRYGIFKAESNLGIVTVDISIYGWGEKITVSQNGNKLYIIDTSDYLDEDDMGYDLYSYEETEDKLIIENIVVKKPFIRTLKRYR
jgi:hypothetical protein